MGNLSPIFDQPWPKQKRFRGQNIGSKTQLDDAKLLWHENLLWVTFRAPSFFGVDNQLALHVNRRHPQIMFEATINTSETIQVCCGRNIGFFSPTSKSKNTLVAVVWIYPKLMLLKVDVNTGKSIELTPAEGTPLLYQGLPEATSKKLAKITMHGTSGMLVYLEGTKKFLGIGHFHRPTDRTPSSFALHGHHYTHVLYTLADTPPYELQDLSNEFCFLSGRLQQPEDDLVCDMIQFAGGLEIVPRLDGNDQLLISYGINDCESATTLISVEAVTALLLSVKR